MKIALVLLIGISISIATALAAPDGPDAKQRAKATTTAKTTGTPKAVESGNAKTAAKTLAKPATVARESKALKTSTSTTNASDKRGKRTLYDFENAGYLYPEIASRRAGYENDGQAYYPQSGYYNGQDAIAQFPNNYIGPHYYPQYLEAPEPIIEIIIKDSNETLPEPEPQPIVTKKKKEKVHVFYVNYKKDQNNKLHLESPIASLNNDDNEEEEEEEEVVHYPVPATPAPPVKTTTLRTIIHPDSEKYHSNSGIHVTFGSEDKYQAGHQLEEHDAESVQSQVVAIPVGSGAQTGSFKTDAYNTRSDFGASAHSPQQAGANQLFTGHFQQAHPQQQQQQQQSQHQYQQHQKQQLPLQQIGNYFRPPAALVQQPSANFYQKQQQSQYQNQQQQQQTQQLQQQQRPQFSSSPKNVANPKPPPPLSQQPLPTLQQLPQLQAQFRKTFGASSSTQGHFYSNYNQQYQQQPSNQQQSFFSSLIQKPAPASPKQSVVFPTAPPKTQELPSRQLGLPYQPVKFRPTLPAQPHIKQVPIPAKLENTNYQNYHQPQPHFQFNRQPQYVQQPTFSLPSPQTTQSSSNNGNYFKQTSQQSHSHSQLLTQKLASSRFQPQQPQQAQQSHQQPLQQVQQQHQEQNQQKTHQQSYQQNQQQTQQQSYQTLQKNRQQSQNQAYHSQQSSLPSPSSPTTASLQSTSDPIRSIHNYFGVQASKETELLKSIPKYEQHITETIETPIGGGASTNGQYNGFGGFGSQTQNQVLHDIPAPHLGPTPAPNTAQQSYQQQQQSSSSFASGSSINTHYLTAAALQSVKNQQQQQQQQQQFSNFVTAQNGKHSAYSTTTPAPPQYAQTTDGEKIMIITPLPPTAYNQYRTTQYQQEPSATQVIASLPSLQTQSATNFVQQPRQSGVGSLISSTVSNAAASGSSQFGVSTFHSDVFKELEQRRNQEKSAASQFSFGSQSASSNDKPYLPAIAVSASNSNYGSVSTASSSTPTPPITHNTDATKNEAKASQTLLQLPDEVPDDLRQQLLSSGILNNADISVLDYDKVGDVALENLPAEHLQHFYGAGGAAQISASKKVVTVVKPNGDKVSLSEKDIERVKQSNALPHKQGVDVKVVHFDAENEKSVSEKYIKTDATVVPPVDLAERQYNRYLPLKINGAQFPLPDSEELRDKKIVSVVVLAPVEAQPPANDSTERRNERDAATDDKEVKFIGGDLIKTLVKKPTKENFKRWLEKEARTDVEQQSVVLLVAKSSDEAEQEIFMYDISTGAVNKLNGELSSAFVNVAEENASSEDLEHASTLDPSVLETMMQKSRR
ncbi:PREDICTED: putative mediator of RNA polymerase II transcription subunit 26 isoform X1 [Bactrocera latifrons]|uniref:putative mediator of RNA polymerase II transcription subunit 26 isoform X1 n=1 Tax=Bactrocera latifrons TaxID=174628 RepID=UPI0008DD1114|nr:PREDICTED: putative mediator of RNA polymerase II transcription subunit 26 isoform X1 [Bactrocera latifrons]